MLNGLDARGRVAMMMWDFYKRLLAHRLITAPIFHLPLTQTQIGSYLGLTVVHVNRVLRALREDLVVSVDKHCVTIRILTRWAGWPSPRHPRARRARTPPSFQKRARRRRYWRHRPMPARENCFPTAWRNRIGRDRRTGCQATERGR